MLRRFRCVQIFLKTQYASQAAALLAVCTCGAVIFVLSIFTDTPSSLPLQLAYVHHTSLQANCWDCRPPGSNRNTVCGKTNPPTLIEVSTRFSLSMEMSRLTRDGTAEPVSRDQILRHARGQGNIIFPVQLTTSRIGNLTRLIHTLLYVMTIHTYILAVPELKQGACVYCSWYNTFAVDYSRYELKKFLDPRDGSYNIPVPWPSPPGEEWHAVHRCQSGTSK